MKKEKVKELAISLGDFSVTELLKKYYETYGETVAGGYLSRMLALWTWEGVLEYYGKGRKTRYRIIKK